MSNENLLTDKNGKISKSNGYFRSTSHKQWTAVTGNEGLTLLSVEILFCDHSNKTSFDSTFARYITTHYRSVFVLGPEKFAFLLKFYFGSKGFHSVTGNFWHVNLIGFTFDSNDSLSTKSELTCFCHDPVP